MIRLVNLVLRDFMSFKMLELDFKRGLHLIQGFNNKGGDSNGAGKTAIMAGITWTLFGKTQVGMQGADLCRWGTDDCVGILTLADEDTTYRIFRSQDTLEFYINGNKQTGHKRELQELINTTFGTDYQKFTAFNIFTQHWSSFLTEVGDAERKRLFKNILQLSQFDKAYDLANKIYDGLSLQATKLESQITHLRQQVSTVSKELQQYSEFASNEDAIRRRTIEEFEARKELLRPDDTDYEAVLRDIDDKLATLQPEELAKQLNQVEQQLTAITGDIYSLEQSVEEYESRIRDFTSTAGAACPTCGQAIPQKHRTMYRAQLEAIKRGKQEELKEVLAVRDKLQEEGYMIRSQLNEVDELQNKRNSTMLLQMQQQSARQKYEEFCKVAETAIERLTETANNYKALITQKSLSLETLQEQLQEKERLFESVTKEMDLYKYIAWLYSRKGVVSLVIERCFNRLKFLANKFLTNISTEGFRIEISGQKQLKSGEFRDEIEIYVLYNNRKLPYRALSAGQQQRINLSLMFALYMWGREIGSNNFDFLLLDEICDLSLGEKGQEDVINMLSAFRDLINQIILITHKTTMSGQYDVTINVVRNADGISSIVS